MNSNGNNCLLLQDEYSLLYSNPNNPNEKIEELADYIARVLEPYKDRVYYFTLPLWNYEEKIWEPKIVGRFYNETTTHWETSREGVGNTIAYKKYIEFFEEAQRYFSFIEFFTNDIEELVPQFSISFKANEFRLSKNSNQKYDGITIRNTSNINSINDKKAFINAASGLLESKDDFEKKIKLGSFYKFLCIYLKHYVDITNIYLFPSLLFEYDDSNRYISSGGVILVCKNPINDESLFQRISIVSNLCFREIGGRNWARVSRNEAVKSAKAAIMSRNMSHNLGSHVMSYLKHEMGSTAAIWKMDASILKNLIRDGRINKEVDLTKLEEVQMPFILGLGHFIGYLQERQDYIATIATDYIPYGAPVNMKDAIYDELNPDLRYKRHNPGESKNCSANILLNYLVKSEGFSRENLNAEKVNADIRSITNKDILFGFPYYNDNGKNAEFWGLNNKIDGGESENPALAELRKLNFSIPGGLVGRQAVFSIMENIIRNAAKHGNTKGVSNLEFKLDVIDLNEISYCPNIEKRINDPKWLDLYMKARDREYLYLLTITDNLLYDNQDDKLLSTLRAGLVEDYIDPTRNMEMINSNKGLKEMRISAAWIRNETNEEKYYRYNDDLPSSDSHHRVKKAPLIAVELTSDNHLRYMFCLQQERFAAIVLDGCDDRQKQVFRFLNKLNSKDWAIFDDVLQVKEKMRSSFRFIVVANKDQYNELRPYSSNRIMMLSDVKLERSLSILDQIKEENHLKELSDLSQDNEVISKLKNQLTGKAHDLEEEIKDQIQKVFYGIDDNSEMIYIWDVASCSEHKNITDVYKKIGLYASDVGAISAQYVYRFHHSLETQFKNFIYPENPDYYKKIRFVEAISGDNSTDRLVRREPLNKRWYYSHLYAMKKRVAIIDERIFKTIHDIDERLFTVTYKEKLNIEFLILGLTTCQKQDEKLKLVDVIIDKMKKANIKLMNRSIQNIETYKKGCRFVAVSNILTNLLKNTISNVVSENYKSLIYQQKGVEVFTIVPVEHGFEIIGCIKQDTNILPILFDSIASIKYDENDCRCHIRLEKEYEDHFKNKYDYISIHQGILDKIYEGFGIKKHTRENVENKKSVSNELFNKFSSYGLDSQDFDYLPCFVIHSGRAKPSNEDMPQKQPFIQYAALEHSVLDCKFALVELLDYAKYES